MSLEGKWAGKKKEVAAEIQLHKVVADIDQLNEIKYGGLVLEEVLDRLKEMEKDCEDVVDFSVVLDWTVSGLLISRRSRGSGR